MGFEPTRCEPTDLKPVSLTTRTYSLDGCAIVIQFYHFSVLLKLADPPSVVGLHALELIVSYHNVEGLVEEIVVGVDLPLRLVLLVHVKIDDEKGLHAVVWLCANESVFEIPHAGIEPATIGSLA